MTSLVASSTLALLKKTPSKYTVNLETFTYTVNREVCYQAPPGLGVLRAPMHS